MKSCVKSFIHRGYHLLQARLSNLQDGEQYLNTSYQHMPTNANALMLMGIRSQQEGNPEEAVKWLTRSLLLDPDFKAPYVYLGISHLRLQAYNKAIEISDAGLARHPETP